jgi:hypothetical protein
MKFLLVLIDCSCATSSKHVVGVIFLNNKLWEKLIAYFSLILHGPHRKRHLQHFFVAAETSLPSCYPATIRGYTDRPTDSPLIGHGPIENDESNNSSIVACVFVAAVTFLPSRCLSTYTYRHTDWWEAFMKYAVKKGLGNMIYIPSLMKIGSSIQKLMGGKVVNRHTDTETHR